MEYNFGSKIIIIDDEPIIIQSTERMLGEFFEIISFSDPEKAKEYFENTKLTEIAVILSDARMPKLSGVDLLSAAAEIAPHISRIILTGFADFNMAKDAVNKGKVHHFLTKPIHPVYLTNHVICGIETFKLKRMQQKNRVKHALGAATVQKLERSLHYFEKITDTESNDLQALMRSSKNYYQAMTAYRKQKFQQALQILENMEPANDFPGHGNLIRSNFLKAEILLNKTARVPESGHKTDLEEKLENCLKEAADLMLENKLEFYLLEAVEHYPALFQWVVSNQVFPEALEHTLDKISGIHPEILLQVYMMGSFKVFLKDEKLDENGLSNKQILLLAFLMSRHGKKISVELILDHFWPEMDQKQALSNFYANLYKLRKFLEPELEKPRNSRFIKFQDRFCWVDSTVVRTDEKQITQLYHQIMADQKNESPDIPLSVYRHFLELYKQPYLEEYLYEDWINEKRENLHKKWQRVLLEYVDKLVSNELFEEAAGAIHTAQLKDPENEELERKKSWLHHEYKTVSI